MVIGNGLLARAFSSCSSDDKVLIFASGTSNSKGDDESEFNREYNLIQNTILKNQDKIFVYFSTSSVLDASLSSSPYCCHKLQMENWIKKQAKRFLIIRASNVVGKFGNRKTIFSYLSDKINTGEFFELWQNAERNLLDIEDVFIIVTGILKENRVNETVYLVNPESVKVTDLVNMIETKLSKKGNYKLINKGSDLNTHRQFELVDGRKYGVIFDEMYYERLINKYIC